MSEFASKMQTTNGRLAICVPSRGRPKTFLRFLQSFYRHATPGLSEVILRNGENDPSKDAYEPFTEGMPNLIRFVGRDTGFNSCDGTAGYCTAQQDIWERYPDYSAYLCIEDDCVLESPGFDRWLLDALNNFPNRVGMIELIDRSQQVQVQCFSAEWCNALGFLCHPEVGEPAFKMAVYLASPGLIARGDGAHFSHYALLGDTGTERSGSPKWTDGTVTRFYEQERFMFNEWLPKHGRELRKRLEDAAYGPS